LPHLSPPKNPNKPSVLTTPQPMEARECWLPKTIFMCNMYSPTSSSAFPFVVQSMRPSPPQHQQQTLDAPPAAATTRELYNEEVVGKALKLLHSALNAFVSRMLQKVFGDSWIERVMDCLQQPQPMAFMTTAFGHVPKEIATNGVAGNESGSRAQELDLRNLLQCITRMWDVFRMVLKPVVR